MSSLQEDNENKFASLDARLVEKCPAFKIMSNSQPFVPFLTMPKMAECKGKRNTVRLLYI